MQMNNLLPALREIASGLICINGSGVNFPSVLKQTSSITRITCYTFIKIKNKSSHLFEIYNFNHIVMKCSTIANISFFPGTHKITSTSFIKPYSVWEDNYTFRNSARDSCNTFNLSCFVINFYSVSC